MRVLPALVSAAAAFAASAFARAIPDDGIATLASANEGPTKNHSCGYAFDTPGNLGGNIRLPAWEVVTYNIRAYVVSGDCGCRFWNNEKAFIAGSGAEAHFIPEGDMMYVGCWHDGHSGHIDVKGFEVNGIQAKALEAKDVAESVNKASREADGSTVAALESVIPHEPISCGDAYSEPGQQGNSVDLPIGALVSIPGKDLRSYKITEKCHCVFRTVGSPRPSITSRTGPDTGDLGAAYGEVVCTGAFLPKRDEPLTVDVPAPAPASADAFYCGYVYTERGLRGTSSAPLEAGPTHFAPRPAHWNSYIFSGFCLCTFATLKTSVDITGPTQGDLNVPFDSVVCRQTGPTKREAIVAAKDLTAVAPPPSLANEDTIYCGYAYSEHGLRGTQVSLPGDTSDVSYKFYKSYIISGKCFCTFTFKDNGSISRLTVAGPKQGELDADAESVRCQSTSNSTPSVPAKRNTAEDKDLAPVLASAAAPKTAYCGYAYSEHGLRGKQISLPRDQGQVYYKYYKSFIITGECDCTFTFRNNGGINTVTVAGPDQGDLLPGSDADLVRCYSANNSLRSIPTKRNTAEDLAPADAPKTPYCGFAYSDFGLRGLEISLPADGSKVSFEFLQSQIIKSGCLCTFASKPGAVPGFIQDVKGPTQGDILISATSVVCRLL